MAPTLAAALLAAAVSATLAKQLLARGRPEVWAFAGARYGSARA